MKTQRAVLRVSKLQSGITVGIVLTFVSLSAHLLATPPGPPPPVPPPSAAQKSGFQVLEKYSGVVTNAMLGRGIQYVNGIVRVEADTAHVRGARFGGGPRLSYINNPENGDASNPNGSNWYCGVPSLVKMSSNEIRCVIDAASSSKYVISGSDYLGTYSLNSKVMNKTTRLNLEGTNGNKTCFYAFTGSAKDGFLDKIVDVNGKKMTATYDGSNRLSTLVDERADTSWQYSYNASSKISLLEFREVTGNALLGSNAYDYFSASYSSGTGTTGDLMKITVTEKDSVGDRTRTTLFRYWTGTWSSMNHGASHKLKYVVGPQAYKELAAAVADPRTATDGQIATYADEYFEYDVSGRVSLARLRSQGCSCSSGQGEFAYAYETNGSWSEASGYGVWKTRVTITNPDASIRIVDINKAGVPIVEVLQTNSPYDSMTDQRWITQCQFDSSGRITEKDNPSACSAYSESTHGVTVSNSSGLIELFAYDGSGNLTSRQVKEGSSGTAYYLEKRTYTSKTLGDNTIQLLTSITRSDSMNWNGTGGDSVTYSYDSFYADSSDLDGDSNTSEDTLAVKQMTVTYPAVPTSQNGSNSATTHLFYFDSLGQLQWEKDELGAITYREHDSKSGALTKEIVNLNTTGFSPSPPTGFSSGSGLSLTSTYAVDAHGRTTEWIDPELRKTMYHYTHLLGGEGVTLSYGHVNTTAHTCKPPVSITVRNLDGNTLTTAVGVPTSQDDNFDNDLTESQSTLEGAFVGDLSFRVEYVYVKGQKTEQREWTDAENSGATKYTTYYGYDEVGHLARVKDAEGTITRTNYSVSGRIIEKRIGTNDHGENLGEASGTSNMTVVEEQFYDGTEGGHPTYVGDGNLTQQKLYANASTTRDVDFNYDWRNRQIAAVGGGGFYEKLDYDNFNRVTTRYRYESSESAGNLRQKATIKYDVLGRVYETVVYEVDPSTGTIDDSLPTDFWYDNRGDLIKKRAPKGAFKKNVFDGARRIATTYVSYDTAESSYGDADDITDDTVMEQVEYSRDGVGNVQLETRYERNSTGTTTGNLTSTIAVRYYLASWYDELHRHKAIANYGTNGGSALSDYDPNTGGTQAYSSGPPASGAGVLVTSYTFNSAGRSENTTDPLGRVRRVEYDNLGRVVRDISNYVNGVPGLGDDDRKIEYAYNGLSQVTSRKTFRTSTLDPEETGYVYGVVVGARPDSDIASNRLLKTIKYADPGSGSPSTSADDQESFAYNAQGEIVYKKDPNGNVHEFDFDDLGRRTADKVTTVGSGVDSGVLRIATTYDALGRMLKTTSYNASTGGTAQNEVELVYNGFGQVKEDRQEHSGTVGVNTLKVVYGYSEADGGDPISRLQSIQYPATSRVVYFHYDDPSGANDYAKMDWILGRPSAVSNNSSISADRVGDYTYQGLGRTVSRVCSEATTDVTVSYAYDQFGRTEYVTGHNSADFNQFRYGYNLNSKVTWKEENIASAKDELYTYDDLDRLDIFKRGDLNGGRTDITSPARSQDWSLDLVGNWGSISTDGATAINRTHNKSNEITDVDGSYSGQDPTYDKNGNTTNIYRPSSASRDFTFDAWNRVRQVKVANIPAITYSYDGLGRRIQDSSGSRDYYYTAGWQLISERNGSTTSYKTLKEYVWGVRYVDEILDRDEDKNSDGDTRDAGDETLFYVQDANWNVQTLCGESGSVVERCQYDPYGAPSFFDSIWGTRSSSSYSNVVLFTGRLWNTTSFTFDYRNREYSPYLGRFIQRDPIGIWGDHINAGNGYSIVGNDSLNRRDSFGLEGEGNADGVLVIEQTCILRGNQIEEADPEEGTCERCACRWSCGCQPGYHPCNTDAMNRSRVQWTFHEKSSDCANSCSEESETNPPKQKCCLDPSGTVKIDDGDEALFANDVGWVFVAVAVAAVDAAIIVDAVIAVEGVAPEPDAPEGGGECFPAGTCVLTEGGCQPIESVSVGQSVVSYDMRCQEWRMAPVSAIFNRNYCGEIVTIVLDDDSVQCTADHPILVIEGEHLEARPLAQYVPIGDILNTSGGFWIDAQYLLPGDVLVGKGNGDETVQAVSIEYATLTVYNIQVAAWSTYLVTSLGLVVHNRAARNNFEKMPQGNNQAHNKVVRNMCKELGFGGPDGAAAREAVKRAIENWKIGNQNLEIDELRQIVEDVLEEWKGK